MPEFKGTHSIYMYYEDTDLSGFVYHANYLKYFERAREHLIGIQYLRHLYDTGVHFVVSKAELTFKSPAMHSDELVIETVGSYSKSPAIPFKQQAFVYRDGKKVLIAEGTVTIVTLNAKNRPIRLPDSTLDYFSNRNTQIMEGETLQ